MFVDGGYVAANDQADSARAGVKQLCDLLGDADVKLQAALREIGQVMGEQSQILGTLGSANHTAQTNLPNLLDAMLGSYLQDVHSHIEHTSEVARDVANTVREFANSMGAVASTAMEIEEIGHQTRLVALNAATTAERAGEQGRAFGVIAQQVTELPLQASLLSTEIREVIEAAEAKLMAAVAQQDLVATQADGKAREARQALQAQRDSMREEAQRVREALVAFSEARRTVEQRVVDAAEPLSELRRQRRTLTNLG